MSAAPQAEVERRVVSAINAAVGERPILLCGSRSLGTASDQSDYDVIVVVPTLRVLAAVRRLRPVATRLEVELGSPMSINPLPTSRVESKSLYAWKVRNEGRVLAAPPGFTLGRAEPPALKPTYEFSYLASATLYLLSSISATTLLDAQGSTQLEDGIRKALLHLGQLRLMRRDQYASSLGEVLERLDDPELSTLAARDDPARFFPVRDAVLAELTPVLHTPAGVLVTNARYAALAALRPRNRVRALALRQPVDRLLAQAAADLLRALRPVGPPDLSLTRRAGRLVPTSVTRAQPASWAAVRDTILREWPDAHPLAAQ